MPDSVNTADKHPGRVERFLSRLNLGLDTVIKLVAIAGALGLVGGAGVIAGTGGLDPSPTPIAQGVPNVYDFSSNQAVTMLKSAGFPARTISVCSSSVAAGKVRQVLTDGGAADGTVLVDMDGVTPFGRTLRGGSVVVKVSTGVPCS